MLEQARQLGRGFLAVWAEVQLRMDANPLLIPHVAFIVFVYILVPTTALSGELIEDYAINIAASIVLEMQDLSSLVSDEVRAALAVDLPCHCSLRTIGRTSDTDVRNHWCACACCAWGDFCRSSQSHNLRRRP